jgi:hypothetical protein
MLPGRQVAPRPALAWPELRPRSGARQWVPPELHVRPVEAACPVLLRRGQTLGGVEP